MKPELQKLVDDLRTTKYYMVSGAEARAKYIVQKLDAFLSYPDLAGAVETDQLRRGFVASISSSKTNAYLLRAYLLGSKKVLEENLADESVSGYRKTKGIHPSQITSVAAKLALEIDDYQEKLQTWFPYDDDREVVRKGLNA